MTVWATRSFGNAGLVFDRYVGNSAVAELGHVVQRTDIKSSIGPFLCLPHYKIRYPKTVIKALGELYGEYNRAFIPLLERNKEWETDYRCCMQDGLPLNFAIQIDMVGLPDGFLQAAADMPSNALREILRRRIFEIENSLAMYQLMEKAFSCVGESHFKRCFRASLHNLRKRFRKPIALLAVTEEKYAAMRASEFGKTGTEDEEPLSDEEILDLSGFDAFFGPEAFKRYLESTGGLCEYLLYARTSDPVAKLKNPDLKVEHPLLQDPAIRRIIKAHTLTFNIDAPDMDSARRINDTKEYQPLMDMAFPVSAQADLFSPEFGEHLYPGKPYADFTGERLSTGFADFLKRREVDPKEVESGAAAIRCKPAKCAYGCYGHVTGILPNNRFRIELRRNLRRREGGYVIQPEMAMPRIANASNGVEYTYIDRNYFAFTDGHPRFMGGFRSLMPVDSSETRNGRNHGNRATVWAEITSQA